MVAADSRWRDRVTHQRRQQWLWLVVIPFLLLTGWLGARNLDKHPFWRDEIYTLRDTRGFSANPRSLTGIWNEVANVNPDHAPGYFMLLNLWGRLTGWQPQTLRVASLLTGLLAIAVTYRIGRRWLSAEAGLAAAIIMAVSPLYVFFYTQTRVYTLTALMSALTLSIYLGIINRRQRPSRWQWAALFVATALTLYAHYLAAIPLIGIGLYHLLFAPKNRRWWMVVIVGIGGALLFTPWIWVLIRGIHKTAESEGLQGLALYSPHVLASFVWYFSNGVVPFMLGLLTVALVALRGPSRQARTARAIAVIALVALVAILALNQAIALIAERRMRYLLPLWPPFALLIAFGITALRRPRGLWIGLLALWIVGGLWTNLAVDFTSTQSGSTLNFPVDQIADALSTQAKKNDLIINYPPDTFTVTEDTYAYYYRLLAGLQISYITADPDDTPEARETLQASLQKRLEAHRRLWLVYTRDTAPAGLSRVKTQIAASGFARCPLDLSAAAPKAGIELYVPEGISCPSG